MGCPFRDEEEHEDTPDADEHLDFTKRPKRGKGLVAKTEKMEVGIPSLPEKVQVGVREPRKGVPRPLERAAVRGHPQPFKTLEDFEGERVRDVMTAAETAVGRVPQKASFSREDFAFFEQNQIFAGQLGVSEQNQKAGQARVDAIQTQMAEEAAAEAVAPAQEASIDVLRELVRRPPAELVAIPLLAEAFRRLRASPLFRSAVPIQPGRRVSSPVRNPTRRVPAGAPPRQTRTGAGGRPPAAGARPVTRGFGGLTFNAAQRMRELVSVSRRTVRPGVGQNISGPNRNRTGL